MLGLAVVQVSTLLSRNTLWSDTGAGLEHLHPKHLMSVCRMSCGHAGQKGGKEAFKHVASCLASPACSREERHETKAFLQEQREKTHC